jgi:hypothetical protein
MDIFVVLQDPVSKYNDVEGKYYNYPTSIPNGKQIREGDFLLFFMSSKASKKLGHNYNLLTGLAKIDNITLYSHFNKQMAMASYSWFRKFEFSLSFEEIGGDPRLNLQHSMNKIENDKKFELMANLIIHL